MASAAFRVTAHMSTCSESRLGACNLEALNEMLAIAAATAASDVAANGPIVHAIALVATATYSASRGGALFWHELSRRRRAAFC